MIQPIEYLYLTGKCCSGYPNCIHKTKVEKDQLLKQIESLNLCCGDILKIYNFINSIKSPSGLVALDRNKLFNIILGQTPIHPTHLHNMSIDEAERKRVKQADLTTHLIMTKFASVPVNTDKARIDRLEGALREIANRHEDHCDYYKFGSENNCKCSASIAKKALSDRGGE